MGSAENRRWDHRLDSFLTKLTGRGLESDDKDEQRLRGWAHSIQSCMRGLLWAVLLGLLTPALIFAQALATINLRGKDQQLYLYGSQGDTPLVLSSGDLGWAGLVVHVAQYLSTKGYFIVGFNSRAYLASFTTKTTTLRPQDVPRDYRLLIDFARKGKPLKSVLGGISEGAGLSVLAATEAELKPSVLGVLALGLPDQNELGWKWQDFTIWVTKRTPNEPAFMVEDLIGKVTPVPLAEIHSTHDEFVSLEQAKQIFARAGAPKQMWMIEAANHRFSNNRAKLDSTLLEALQWIKSNCCPAIAR
jgi:hypothetical protein